MMLWPPRALLLGVAASLAAAGLAVAAPSPGVGEPVSPDPGRQLLVMIRQPPEHFRAYTDYVGSYGDGLGRGARRRVAEGLARSNGLTLVDDWPMPLVGVDCFVMTAPAGQSPETAAARLSRSAQVAWAEPMSLYEAQGAPEATHDDPLYPTQPAAREWRLASLHRVATGRNVRIAVVDSSVELSHPDLKGQVETSQNFVQGRANAPEAHGTGVAGVIAAIADNHIGIAGVAPRAKLMALRACWQLAPVPGKAAATVCDTLSLAKALDFAIVHDAQVINLSLAGPPDRLLGKLLDVAQAHRIVVVAAFDPALPGGGFPASYPGVIAVADEFLAAPPPGVYSAPGRDVPTTTLGGHWGLVSGSSFAAAHVSGLLALVRERRSLSSGLARLVTAQPGAVVDACATLLGAAQSCASGRIREAAVSDRP